MPEFPQAEALRAVVDHVDTGVFVVDRERKIVYWNRGVEAVTGYLSQEMVGRVCGDNLLVHCGEHDNELCSADCPVTDALRDGTEAASAMLRIGAQTMRHALPLCRTVTEPTWKRLPADCCRSFAAPVCPGGETCSW